jgi:Na+/H+-translocating membrane pyrophosphatase
MTSFTYEKGYYIIYGPMMGYYHRLWACIYAPVTGLIEGKYTTLFNSYYASKRARHTCLICNAASTDEGYIVTTADNPGTAKYICEDHYEILLVLENLRKL